VSKLGLVGWALALALGLILALGSGDDAEAERAARQAAEERALKADSAAAKAWAARNALADSLARQDSIWADSLARAREASEVAVGQANERTGRLRAQLTAEQQRELDQITAFWETAVAEERRATEAAERRTALAKAEAAANLRLAKMERDSTVAHWRDAYEAAVVEIEALRSPGFLSLDFADVPKLAIAGGAVYLLTR